MKTEALVLEGTDGLVAGERFAIGSGREACIGRSRKCDLHLDGIPKRRSLKRKERLHDKPFLSISRRHVRIRCYNAGFVELESLGSHGSFLDGQPVSWKVLTDLRAEKHTLRLGLRETLTLCWGEVDDSETPILGKSVFAVVPPIERPAGS